MSYLNQAHDPRRRATAVSVTVAVHAALGIAVVTGLSVAGYKPVRIIDPIIDFPTPPEPPKPTPTETPEQAKDVITFVPTPLPPPVPPRDWPPFTPEKTTTDTNLYPTGGETQNPPAPPPSPPPAFTPKRAVPSNSSAGWITNNDYPRRALVDEAEGSASYRLVIGTNGRVSSCELTSPTGNRALDDATCRLITSRARFESATDENGAKVMGTYTGSVRWEIPD